MNNSAFLSRLTLASFPMTTLRCSSVRACNVSRHGSKNQTALPTAVFNLVSVPTTLSRWATVLISPISRCLATSLLVAQATKLLLIFGTDLGIKLGCTVHVHQDHKNYDILWKHLGYPVVFDEECTWSDGDIGGYCCEVYKGNLEIGNLVNPLEHSTDVGFGWERMLMVLEGRDRVDETSLFDQSLPPVCRDHERTLNCLWQNGINPSNKGRNYVCRRLLRRILQYDLTKKFLFQDWIESERQLREKSIKLARRLWRKHKDKDYHWWKDTCGITQEELTLIQG